AVMAQGLGGGRFELSAVAYAPGPYGLAAIDFDRDGRLDLAVAQTGSAGGVAKLRNATVPKAVFDDYLLYPGETLTVPQWDGVLGNDLGINLHAVLLTLPQHGTLSFLDDGSFTYTPDAGFIGADSFTYAAAAAGLQSNPT